MTKQAWQNHMAYERAHDPQGCAQCEARRATKRAARLRRERDDALRGIGMVKVRGALGGTYWE